MRVQEIVTLALPGVVAGMACPGASSQGFSSNANRGSKCPPLAPGNIVFDIPYWYMEASIWDDDNCLLYTSANTNSTSVAVSPYTKEVVATYEYPGITLNDKFHASGVRISTEDPNQLAGVLIDKAAAQSSGKTRTTDNYFIVVDIVTGEFKANVSMNAVSGDEAIIFPQDVEYDTQGNAYVLSTIPSALMKVPALSSGEEPFMWYSAEPYAETKSIFGYSGIIAIGDTMLVVEAHGNLYTFDATADVGTPVEVAMTPSNFTYADTDAISLPAMYDNTVLLVADDYAGVQVIKSEDNWTTAEYKGIITLADLGLGSDAFMVSALQVSNRIFAVPNYFLDEPVTSWLSGNRSIFEWFDITDRVATLLES